MDNNLDEAVLDPETTKKDEHFIAGLVGSFLFSLAGVVVWFLIYQIGFIASIAGLVTVICAIKGYEIFGKVLSLKGLIVSLLITLAMIFISGYICLGYDIYSALKEEIDITIFDALRSVKGFLTEEEIRSGFVKDLAMGYGLSLLGSYRYIANMFKSIKKKKAEELSD